MYYQLTYAKRSGHGGYLNQAFFMQLLETMAENLVLVRVTHEGVAVAAALSFMGGDRLYGRYWGCSKEYDVLHFEACYYQGIDFCIERGLQYFDPGAQGEHKIQRGFAPVAIWSNHWIADARFSVAIQDFLKREKVGIVQYIRDASDLLPFKKNN